MSNNAALKILVWSLVPGAAGLLLGGVSSYSLTFFIGILVLVVGVVAYWLGAQYRRGGRTADCPQVRSSAGVLYGLGFLFGYFTGLSWAAGHGLFVDVLSLSVLSCLLAAFFLTVVQNFVDGRYAGLSRLLDRIFPESGGHDHALDDERYNGKAR